MPSPLPLRPAQTIAVLALTQVIGWGTTFESLTVLGRVVAADIDLANEIVFAGLTVMMLVSAVIGPATGRLLQRHGAARVLACGSALFGAGLTLIAATEGLIQYMLGWTLLGIGGAFGLSSTAHAAVVEREGAGSRRTIAVLLLFTGLSATVCWPLLSLLNGMIGWRMTFLTCAGLHLFVCLPLHLFGLPRPSTGRDGAAQAGIAPVALTPAERRSAFLLVAAATTLTTFVTFGLSPSLIELLQRAGAGPDLALQLASARGVIAVSARGLDMLLGRRGNPFVTSIAGAAAMLAGLACLPALPASGASLVLFILLYGIGSGILVVARALLPLALFSAREYGLQAARLTLPQNLANAVAPVVFTALLDRVGTDAAIGVALALSALSLGFILLLIGLVRRARRRETITP